MPKKLPKIESTIEYHVTWNVQWEWGMSYGAHPDGKEVFSTYEEAKDRVDEMIGSTAYNLSWIKIIEVKTRTHELLHIRDF